MAGSVEQQAEQAAAAAWVHREERDELLDYMMTLPLRKRKAILAVFRAALEQGISIAAAMADAADFVDHHYALPDWLRGPALQMLLAEVEP
jgi:hypothetical protein